MTDAQVRRLPTSSDDAVAEARAQADAYDSIFADTELPLENGVVLQIPPHPDFGMFDDDALERYEDLLFEVDTTYDRDPDIYIPEQRLRNPDGSENGVVLPPETHRGQLKRPYQKDGARVTPAHSVKVVQAVLGDDQYKVLRDNGGSARDVWKIWGKQGLEAKARQEADKFRAGRPVDLAAVPPANRK